MHDRATDPLRTDGDPEHAFGGPASAHSAPNGHDAPPALPAPSLASREWFLLVYDQLRAIAERSFSDERRGSGASDHTLSPTALVHEAFLKLSRAEERGTLQTLESREFFPAAARAMREILVDHARRRRARLEGEGRMIKLVGARDVPAFGSRFLDSGPTRAADVIDLDRVLAALEAIDPDAACLVSLRFFAGLTVEQSSRVLGLGQTATEGLWRFARAWMGRALTQ